MTSRSWRRSGPSRRRRPRTLGELTVEADWLDTNAMGRDDRWAGVSFTTTFDEPPAVPAVFASVMSYAGSDAVTTRIQNLDTLGFDLAMDEQKNKDPWHVSETLGWIAIQQGSTSTAEGRKVQVFATGLNDELTAVSYPSTTSHRHPTVVGDVDTTYEADPVFLRYASPTNAQIQLKLTEDNSDGSGTVHDPLEPEAVGIFVGE